MKKHNTKLKSEKLLADFNKYCIDNPELRFWQALASWSGGNIYHQDELDIIDTYYWNKKDK